MRRGLGVCAAVALALGLAASASAARRVGPSSPADAQQRLADVYARPPLDRLDRPPPRTPLDDILSRIGDLFSRLPSSFPGALPVLIIVLLALALLIAWQLRRVSAGRQLSAIEPEPDGSRLDADA